MSWLVQRRWSDAKSVTGELFHNGSHRCWTLEPPYRRREWDVKVKPYAIPAGTYDLTIRFSQRFQRLMPHVENVPGFSGILIHWGNFPKDTEGCTLVGSMRNTDFVGHSVDEFNDLFAELTEVLAQGPQTITYLDTPKEYS